MRIAILGFGSVGGCFGARLVQAGADVVFLSRPGRAAAELPRKLRLSSPLGDWEGGVTVCPANEFEDRVDLVLVAPKAVNLAAALLPMLNGVRRSWSGSAHGPLCKPAKSKEQRSAAPHRVRTADANSSPRMKAVKETPMALEIRKLATFHEEVMIDLRPLAKPFRHVVVAAVISNPWCGRGFIEDLSPEIKEFAAPLGRLLARRAVEILGKADSVEAFGKAAMAGLDGEYEHANALIHTTLFGDECRAAVEGSAWMVGNQKICPTGSVLELPMAHKHDAKLQNYYHTIHLYLHDAPRGNELVVAVGMASGVRPNGRL